MWSDLGKGFATGGRVEQVSGLLGAGNAPALDAAPPAPKSASFIAGEISQEMLIGLTPAGVALDVADTIQGGADLYANVRRGDWGGAGLSLAGLGLVAVGYVPGVGDLVKGIGRQGLEAVAGRLARAADVADQVADMAGAPPAVTTNPLASGSQQVVAEEVALPQTLEPNEGEYRRGAEQASAAAYDPSPAKAPDNLEKAERAQAARTGRGPIVQIEPDVRWKHTTQGRLLGLPDTHAHPEMVEPVVEHAINMHDATFDNVIWLGDYGDKGPDTKGVVDLILDSRSAFPGANVETIMGNHDNITRMAFFDPRTVDVGRQIIADGNVDDVASRRTIDAMNRDELTHWAAREAARWFDSKKMGRPTLASYGAQNFRDLEVDLAKLDLTDFDGLLSWHDKLRGRINEVLPPEHVAFWTSDMPLSVTVEDYFASHAGARPGRALTEQDPVDLLWIRKDFHESQYDFGKLVVYGHAPWPKVEVRPNRVGLDTGPDKWNRYAAAVFDGDDVRFIFKFGDEPTFDVTLQEGVSRGLVNYDSW